MKISTVLTLEFKAPGQETDTYNCKIIETGEDFFLIDYPIHRKTKKTKFFPTNTTFLASYIGEDNAIYEFPTKIVERVKLNIPAIKMTLPEEEQIKRIQRREYVRVDAAVDTAVHSPTNHINPFTTVSVDISGGGMSFINQDKITMQMNDQLDIWFALRYHSGEIYYVNTKAEIVFLGMRNRLNTTAVKFLDLQPKDQQMMVRFTFEKQREMYQKLKMNRK